MKIFISYSHVDAKVAQSIYQLAAKRGFSPRLDEKDISGGEIIDEKVATILASCQVVVVVISPSSIRSPWVFYEIGRADESGKVIVPFLTHQGLSSDLPIFLQKRKYVSSLKELNKFFVGLCSLTLPDQHLLSLYQVGLASVHKSRRAIPDYFWHFAQHAKKEVKCLFVTGNFFGAVNLENCIQRSPEVSFRFLLFNPAMVEKRNRDLHREQYKIQRPEWETVLRTIARNRNATAKIYDDYPFWHLLLVDEAFVVVSYNPHGALGFNTSPVYVFENTGVQGNLWTAFCKYYEVIWRDAAEVRVTKEITVKKRARTY